MIDGTARARWAGTNIEYLLTGTLSISRSKYTRIFATRVQPLILCVHLMVLHVANTLNLSHIAGRVDTKWVEFVVVDIHFLLLPTLYLKFSFSHCIHVHGEALCFWQSPRDFNFLLVAEWQSNIVRGKRVICHSCKRELDNAGVAFLKFWDINFVCHQMLVERFAKTHDYFLLTLA